MFLMDHNGDVVETGLDVDRRRIYFGICTDPTLEDIGEVTTRSIELAVRALHVLVNADPHKPIELYMNSSGGDPYAMLRLYDEILSCPCPVKFFGGGIIQSSATWIMCACDERYLFPNTTVMIHDGTESIKGTHTDTKIELAEAVRLQDMLYDVYAANSKMPKSFWQDVCQRDLYLTAAETCQLGLADSIIQPKNRSAFRERRDVHLAKPLSSNEKDELTDRLLARISRSRSRL
jgi:ATP-dependent Clp protease protease subunit